MFATGFGLGLSPFASGTVGTALGVLLAVAMAALPWTVHAVVSVGLIVLAVPLCHAAEGILGKKDDGRVVADEYLTFPLVVIGIPWTEHLWLLGVAFLAHRILDILKPPPAYQCQRLKGGLGIVLDDVVSSLYALGVMHAVVALLLR